MKRERLLWTAMALALFAVLAIWLGGGRAWAGCNLPAGKEVTLTASASVVCVGDTFTLSVANVTGASGDSLGLTTRGTGSVSPTPTSITVDDPAPLTLTATAAGEYTITISSGIAGQCSVTITVLKVDFINNQNVAIPPETHAVNISNHVTDDDKLPASSDFADTVDDMDNFRLEVDDASAGSSVQVKVEVIEGGTSVSQDAYTLDKKSGSKYRGQFLRLVTDVPDNAVAGAQTRLVKLGSTLRLTYPVNNPVCTKDIQVGRPISEDNNATGSQLKHDIRELKAHVLVFRNRDNTAPALTRAQVQADIDSANERLAQSTIRLNVLGIDMGGTGDPGVSLPTALQNGFAARSGTLTTLSDDEAAVVGLKDGDDNSIDVFYVDYLYVGINNPVGGVSYSQYRNNTGNPAADNVVVLGPDVDVKGPLTLPHEIMHILLNMGHRDSTPADPATALFHPPGNHDKSVHNEKRIGPYPDAITSGAGVDDTFTIRGKAEALP